MKGYKAYNKGLTCRGFQFKEGETYEEKKAAICDSGFHFCKNPMDVLNYYSLVDSEFTTVEAIGEIDKQIGENHENRSHKKYNQTSHPTRF